MKYIYESPDKGKTIYRREFGKYDKKIVMNNTMMSLYDYLGRAAGPELGQQVASAAARKKVKFQQGMLNKEDIKEMLCYILNRF